MNESDIEKILKANASGEISIEEATERLKNLSYETSATRGLTTRAPRGKVFPK
jgi:hypothetical protein